MILKQIKILLLAIGLLLQQSLPAAEPFIPPVPDKQPEPPFPATPPNAGVLMLVPGFTVRELPVKLSNLNNVEYAPDGRLFAGGYDGRFHLLRDTDGDGLEDKVDTFGSESGENYPLGLVVKDGSPYAVLTDEVVRYRDTNGDGVPDRRETMIKGFDDPELVQAPYLVHRRVDSSLALAIGPDDALYVTMGSSAPANAYWTDKAGVKHYSTEKRRGCLLRIGKDGQVEQLATGLRYIMSLQWNRHGDLFGADQEGATWVPNGNPFDELLHLQPGRHYGFPPYHPRWLTNVVDEPSVWDYAPQHQSTCGFRFNGPSPGRGRFGPAFWADNAIVTGEARGKLWRTALAKTAAGYVARTELFAQLGMLAVDCAISPQGDLVICCHSGAPDWGNGPKGEGRIFQISYTDQTAPQPVLTWPASETQTVITFNRPLDATAWGKMAGRTKIQAGRSVAAADRLETLRPGYDVVKKQQEEKPEVIPIRRAQVEAANRQLVIETPPRKSAVHYALTIESPNGALDVAHDLSGVAAEWRGAKTGTWQGWLPHPDFTAAREFTRASAPHDALWQKLATPGTLTLRAQLDLWQMLIPATQPGSKLDYVPAPETVTVVFHSDAVLSIVCDPAKVQRVSQRETHLTIVAPQANRWLPFALTLTTPARTLDISYATPRDSQSRALATRRFLMPFATPATRSDAARIIPEIAGGDWNAGRAIFNGKVGCVTCHKIRGDGASVGPDLSNLLHRDYTSVLKDIVDPNATINPDAVGYVITLKDGEEVTGTRWSETASELQIAQAGGRIVTVQKSSIRKSEPMTISLMPTGLEQGLTPAELRDLMTFLLTEAPRQNAK
jgi:putative heme-binding domain-containing protein